LDAVDQFVTATLVMGEAGEKELLSIETIDEIPESRFYENRTLAQIITEQDLKPPGEFGSLSMEDADTVSAEEFSAFIRDLRGEAS